VAKPYPKSDSETARGRLSVVATPIGNLGDLSARAREVLAASDTIAAEDTRNTRNLLQHFGIDRPLVSLHEHNERERAQDLIARMLAGAQVALVSDAGTPAISDPGFLLVRAAAQAGIEVQAIPGPCAAIAALSVAGLPTDRFCFEGFLPASSGARRKRLAELTVETRTLVFYEAPHRIEDTLRACEQAFGAERAAVVAREITKRFETLYRGSLAELLARSATDADFSRGEIVLIVAGAAQQEDAGDRAVELDRMLRILLAELPVKQAADLAAKLAGVRNNESYKRALQLKDQSVKDR
jgi:16S rRNA (cytidine1402-2'-O)-methyltransferase